MLFDVDAAVLENRRLSETTTCSSLAAPAIAAADEARAVRDAEADTGTDPLLRRPFSVFEVIRDGERRAGRPSRC